MAGSLVAAAVGVPERVAATVTAFGGGTLLVAIALELVPEADGEAGALTASGCSRARWSTGQRTPGSLATRR